MQKISKLITRGLVVMALVFSAVTLLNPAQVYAGSPRDAVSEGVVGAGGGSPNQGAIEKGIKNIVNVLLYILGAIAVIMIVIGGIKYTTSNGDSAAVTSAKNTILYAVIGLIVAILAFAIVNFVLSAF